MSKKYLGIDTTQSYRLHIRCIGFVRILKQFGMKSRSVAVLWIIDIMATQLKPWHTDEDVDTTPLTFHREESGPQVAPFSRPLLTKLDQRRALNFATKDV